MQWAVVVLSLAALALQLPSPQAALHTLTGDAPVRMPAGVADAAMLCLAAAVIWLLLAWVLVLTVVALGGRLPGVLGSAARAGLAVLAPVTVRNVLVTVVGASVVTGLAGCATGASARTPPSPAGAIVATTAAPRSAPAPSGAERTTAAAQLRAERLIGIATLQISHRLAVEGSAVRSGDPAPADGQSAAPDVDWPVAAGSGKSTGSSTSAGPDRSAHSADSANPARPAGAPGSTGTARSASSPGSTNPARSAGTPGSQVAAPTVSVDWPGPAAASAHSSDTSVVVLRGDSLWAIAARSLPAGADDAQIDRTWRAWYAANASVIGSDPNYLLPGQILAPPNPGTGTPR